MKYLIQEMGINMLRIHQIKCRLDEDSSLLKQKCADKLHIPITDILSLQIVKESIDARKQPLCFSYVVDIEVKKEARLLKHADVMRISPYHYELPSCGKEAGEGRVIVAGFGPGGMYAALLLAQMGYRPLVLEKGDAMESRVKKVQAFWQMGILDPSCNVQFGEGGAGTFSDGKLTSRSKDPRSHKVLAELVRFGAPAAILYEAYPHIGTDRLRDIVVAIRKEIIALGGEIRFASPVIDLHCVQNRITHVQTKDDLIPCKALILAVGHSARDIYQLFERKQIAMMPKSFAVGVRIEHPQEMINRVQYKEFADHPRLLAASYRLSYTTEKQRGVYTFCMCPGGSVVASSSQCGGFVVNGMSEHARDKVNANSALLVQVHPQDVGDQLLDGIRFQQTLEEKAFLVGGSNYHAPIQTVKDFMARQASSSLGAITPSVQPGYTLCDLHSILPTFVSDALTEALPIFDRRLPGFMRDDALLTAVETRSSSPLRILRDQASLASTSLHNLYPCGEGAGYAGGIVSSAIDGLRCAEKVIERFTKDSEA